MLALVMAVLLSSLAAAQNDYETRRCDRIDPSDPCYRDLAIARGDAAICRLIESVSTRNNCYSKIAENTNDKALCLNIRQDRGSFEDKYECYEEFIVGIEDHDFCIKELKGDEKSVDACLLKIAQKEQDVALCDALSFEDAQMKCILAIARSRQDADACSLIKAKINMKECLSQQGSSCDTREEIDEAVFDCEQEIHVEQRKTLCRSHQGSKEVYLDHAEVQDLNFRGWEDAVHFRYKTASLETQVAVFDIDTGKSSRETTLQPGMTAEHRFVNVYLIDIIERGTEEAPEDPRLFLCVYPDSKPREYFIPSHQDGKTSSEPEPVVAEEPLEEQTEESAEEEPPQKSGALMSTRQTFFEWLSGVVRGLGGFLKKILI